MSFQEISGIYIVIRFFFFLFVCASNLNTYTSIMPFFIICMCLKVYIYYASLEISQQPVDQSPRLYQKLQYFVNAVWALQTITIFIMSTKIEFIEHKRYSGAASSASPIDTPCIQRTPAILVGGLQTLCFPLQSRTFNLISAQTNKINNKFKEKYPL